MRRYLNIYAAFFTSALQRELEFRANFFAKIIQNVVWLSFGLLILFVIYRNTNEVAGWTRGQAFVLAATTTFMSSLFSALFFSLPEIPEQVRQGTLDFVVLKPVDSMFWISTRKFNFDQLGNIFAGVVLIVYGLTQSGIHPAFLDWVGYISLMGTGTMLFYGFNLILMTSGIWLVKVDNLWVVSEMVGQITRYPIDIFGAAARRVLTIYIPLAFLATIPTEQVVRGFNPNMVALGFVWAIVMVGAARAFWQYAMRHYSSASS